MSGKKKPEWPEEALWATIQNYGGELHSPLNGKVVDVQGYFPDEGYFECFEPDFPTEIVLCRREELDAGNDTTKLYLDNCVEAGVEMYEDEIYDLRNALDEIADIQVKAASIDAWDGNQRRTIWGWLKVIEMGGSSAMPEHLKAVT